MRIIAKNASKVYKVRKGFFKFKSITPLKDFNYNVEKGEIIGIVGEGSSGKTTIVNLLSGKVKPTKGEVYVNDIVGNKSSFDGMIVFDNFETKLIENQSVLNNALSYKDKKHISEIEIEKKINDLRDTLDLKDILNKRVDSLDKISRIKVVLLLSLLGKVEALFFDKALSNLDTITKSQLLKILKRLNKEFKITIIIATEDIMDIEKICRRVTVLKDGKVVIDDAFENVKAKYWNTKNIGIFFNKTFNAPRGDFEIIEMSDYYLKVEIDFNKCSFADLIEQFDINTIIDINISRSASYK